MQKGIRSSIWKIHANLHLGGVDMQKAIRFGILGIGFMLLALTACTTPPAIGDGEAVRWQGTVEAVLPDGLQVSGQRVRWTGDTQILGQVQVGSQVEIEGTRSNGALNAMVIRVQSSGGSAAMSAVATGTFVSPLPTPTSWIEFKGTVEEVLPNGYRIAGQTVIVTTTTRIDGPIAVGTFVEVKGVLQADGSILAVHIHLEEPEQKDAKVEFKGVVEEVLPNGYRVSGRIVVVTGSTKVKGPIAVGDWVEVEGVLQADGSVLAYEIEVKGAPGSGKSAKVEFKGVVEEVLPNGYRVSGRIVVVTDFTKVKGPIAVGNWVEVEGVLQADGSVLAYEIEVKGAPGSGKDDSRHDDSRSSDDSHHSDSYSGDDSHHGDSHGSGDSHHDDDHDDDDD